MSPPVEDFLASLRSRETEKTYRKGIKLLVGDGDKFADMVRSDRRAAEAFVIKKVIVLREKIRPATLASYVAATKSFLEHEELTQVNWKKIKKSVPPARFHASDRGPSVEEIRRVLKYCSGRETALALMMCSGGFRVGALSWLNVDDYQKLPSGIGRLRVYRGAVEEYFCFISPEACAALEKHFEERRRLGEELLSDSPMFRRRFDMVKKGTVVKRVSVSSIENTFGRLWISSGVRAKCVERKGRAEFKRVHGFRKFFKTRAEQVMKRNDVELLMGHLEGIDASYYKPPLDLLEREYLKAVPLLTISETEEIRREYGDKFALETKKREEIERIILRLKADVEYLKEQDRNNNDSDRDKM